MSLTNPIGNAEISTDTSVGKITGDTNPATTQDGLTTKLRDADDEIDTALAALKTLFDAHDHDPATMTGPGGPQIGTSGEHSIEDAAITTALIAATAITGGKTAASAITTTAILDDSVAHAQIGIPRSHQVTVDGGGGTANKAFGKPVLFCVAGNDPNMEYVTVAFNGTTMTLTNGGSGPVSVTIYYAGAA
jgi:hypothetical protein